MTPSDRKHRYWTPYVLGLATMLLLGVLWQGVGSPPSAHAQVPDSGAQRIEMIQQQRITNQKLTEIVKLLTQIRDRKEGDRQAKGTERSSKQPVKP